MEPLEPVRAQVKQNLILIRLLMALTLAFLIGMSFTHLGPRAWAGHVFLGLLAASFLPFFFLEEKKLEGVRFQYLFFTLDLVFLLGALYLVDSLTTSVLLCIFMTLFMSALSQSIGRSIAVAFMAVGLFYYLQSLQDPRFDPQQPLFLLLCALHLVVAVHSGYLAYRAVEEEKHLVRLAREAAQLTEKVKEAGQAGQEYAMSFKKILDSLPLGAIAVSRDGSILMANVTAGKILGQNTRNLTNLSVRKPGPLREIGERMARALQDQQEIRKEYLEAEWDGRPKRFRIDSNFGKGPNGETWGMLFLIQETVRPSAEAAPGTEPAAGSNAGRESSTT